MAPLLHPIPPGRAAPPIRFSTEYRRRRLADDRDILERIVAAYRHARATTPEPLGDRMWGTLWSESGFDRRQAGLIDALERGSLSDVHFHLRQFFISDAAHGLALGRHEAHVVSLDAEHYGWMWLDRLVGLAHAIAARPIPNPEDNPTGWATCLDVDPEVVAEEIEQRLGIALEFPDICGVFGGELRQRPFPFIAFTHLLVAWNLKQLRPVPEPRLVEIGGGFGGLAWFATRLFPCRYVIYDLPFAGAIQAYFLHRALPDCRLGLWGEDDHEATIRLIPAVELLQPSADVGPIDLVVNQDSLPEIPRRTAMAYLRTLAKTLRGPFLSVNHESPARDPDRFDRTSVCRLVEEIGSYRLVQRSPFPLRLGYVQEVYLPSELSIGGWRPIQPRL